MKKSDFLNSRSIILSFAFLIASTIVFDTQTFSQEQKVFNPNIEIITENPLPPGWDTYSIVGNPHGIIVMLEANPRIGDVPIMPGDYIGAFFEDDNGDLKCGGADFWLGDDNIIFGAFGDDPDTPEKDGFLFGEQMYFKFYSYTTLKEYDINQIVFDPTTYSGTDIWYPLAISQVIDMVSLVDFDAYALATPNPVCIGNSVLLTANIFIGTTGNYTYLWTSNPSGFTSNEQNPIVDPVENTTYILEVSDGSLVSGSEIDVIVNLPATLVAGPGGTICEDESASLSAEATNYGGILWSTSGDGEFDDPGSLNPFYSPGTLDAENGFAELTVLALPLDDCVFSPSDEVTVTIARQPNLNLPASTSFCEIQDIWLDAGADEYSSLIWTTSGDGTFTNPDSSITQYLPGNFDYSLGEFTLTCCADATSPCQGSECAEIFCELSASSTVNAPGSRTTCEDSPVSLISVAFNYSAVLWTTDGDGYFENPEALSTDYYPGPMDLENGGTVVTVNAFGFDACQTVPAKKNVNIIIIHQPTVDAGDLSEICGTQPIQLNGTIENYSSFYWATSGDGYFNSTTVMFPIYYPGINDSTTGNFNLSLTAQPIAPCTGVVSDELQIEVIKQVQVLINTPSNQELCAGIDLQLEAWADGGTGILWETTGDGYFDDPAALNPVYYHGPVSDLDGNPVVLKITAFATPGCGSDVSDEINVTYFKEPTANAGEDFTACEDNIFVSGTAENFTDVSWQTNGDGYFVDPSLLISQYIPGSQDLGSGTVELCLVTYGIANCPDASDCLVVSIISDPTADIGVVEAFICYNDTFAFDLAAFSNTSAVNWFTTDGGGTFNDPSITNPVYTPDPVIDYALGCITLNVSAEPLSPCTISAEDNMQLCFDAPPEISLGPDATIVEVETYNIDATVVNYSSVLWTTSGDGTFANPLLLATEYTPGAQDIQNESVALTLTAYPLNAACPDPATSSLSLSIMRQQNILFQTGWNGFSSFVDPQDPAFEEVVSPISNQLEFAQNMTEVYWPEYGINTIGDFENDKAYNVRLNANATLPITGFAETDKTVLLPEGWSNLPVISDCTVAYTELISQLGDELIAVTEIGGTGMLYPGQGIYNLPELEPGKAYSIKMAASAAFTFPACSK